MKRLLMAALLMVSLVRAAEFAAWPEDLAQEHTVTIGAGGPMLGETTAVEIRNFADEIKDNTDCCWTLTKNGWLHVSDSPAPAAAIAMPVLAAAAVPAPTPDAPFGNALLDAIWKMRTELTMLIVSGIYALLKKMDANKQALITKAVGAAHAVFNTVFDMGLIKNSTFKQAENEFWNQFSAKYIEAHGEAPDDAAESVGHAEFTQLFTAHTGDEIPALKAA